MNKNEKTHKIIGSVFIFLTKINYRMYRALLLLLLLFHFDNVLAQNDSIPHVVIDHLEIKADTSLKIISKDGKMVNMRYIPKVRRLKIQKMFGKD